jgi:hypothetical protein
MGFSNIKKREQPQTNLKQGNEVRRMTIVNYFQIKFDKDACVLPIVEHRNR